MQRPALRSPRPTAITDSPIAISRISPCRSTKWAARMWNPDVLVKNGVNQWATNATIHSVHSSHPVGEPRDQQQRSRDHVVRPEPPGIDRTALSSRRLQEHPRVHGVHDQVADPERHPGVPEGVGDGQRDDQERRHPDAGSADARPGRAAGPRS